MAKHTVASLAERLEQIETRMHEQSEALANIAERIEKGNLPDDVADSLRTDMIALGEYFEERQEQVNWLLAEAHYKADQLKAYATGTRGMAKKALAALSGNRAPSSSKRTNQRPTHRGLDNAPKIEGEIPTVEAGKGVKCPEPGGCGNYHENVGQVKACYARRMARN